jgi:3-hydroxybutyryl-CoA dehydrogenase
VLPHIERSTAPSPYLEKLVADGKLGMKSEQGFYAWTAEKKDALRRRVLDHLKQARANDV